MNIFQVLSQGKGRLNEENLSAMLAFLLNPQQSHGLRDLLLPSQTPKNTRILGRDIIKALKK